MTIIKIKGALFHLEDYPIVNNFSGLLLGNTFNPAVHASYEYSETRARFCFTHPKQGRVCVDGQFHADRMPSDLPTGLGADAHDGNMDGNEARVPQALLSLATGTVSPVLFAQGTTRIGLPELLKAVDRSIATFTPQDVVRFFHQVTMRHLRYTAASFKVSVSYKD